MKTALTIRNAEVVLPVRTERTDVSVINGRICAIGNEIPDVGEVIDADGLFLLPGIIDPQVHFREPGADHKEDLHSGSCAAAAGGVTSFLDMPNNTPPVITRQRMQGKKQLAAEKSVVNYGFFMGATPDNLEELNAVENVCGIKIFMGSSTGDLLVGCFGKNFCQRLPSDSSTCGRRICSSGKQSIVQGYFGRTHSHPAPK